MLALLALSWVLVQLPGAAPPALRGRSLLAVLAPGFLWLPIVLALASYGSRPGFVCFDCLLGLLDWLACVAAFANTEFRVDAQISEFCNVWLLGNSVDCVDFSQLSLRCSLGGNSARQPTESLWEQNVCARIQSSLGQFHSTRALHRRPRALGADAHVNYNAGRQTANIVS